MKDYIVRATAAEGQVRAFAATTKELVETAREHHNTSPVATAALGRLLTAGAMMGSMMKNETDMLTLQVRGDGPLGGRRGGPRPAGRGSLHRRQRPLRLRHRRADHAPHHRRRRVEPGHQRHDRLGLRGGVRLHARLRLLARRQAAGLPALRRVAGAPDGDDALRRQALQRGLLVQIPQGRGEELDVAALGRRP